MGGKRHSVELLVKDILAETHADEDSEHYPVPHVTYRFERPAATEAPIPTEQKPLFSDLVEPLFYTILENCARFSTGWIYNSVGNGGATPRVWPMLCWSANTEDLVLQKQGQAPPSPIPTQTPARARAC